MNEEFTRYLNAIGITTSLQERVGTICEFYQDIRADEIIGIFVTDYIKKDGSRVYENLWLFSGKYCMEAKEFIIKDDFDITPIHKRVLYWEIQKQKYDFKKATEQSKVHLRLRVGTHIIGELKASKENCDYLKNIILKYIMPNLEG